MRRYDGTVTFVCASTSRVVPIVRAVMLWTRRIATHPTARIDCVSQGDCTLRMRKGPIEFAQVLKPRTLYMLRGPAREIWEHAVDDVHGERISIVFRSKRQ